MIVAVFNSQQKVIVDGVGIGKIGNVKRRDILPLNLLQGNGSLKNLGGA